VILGHEAPRVGELRESGDDLLATPEARRIRSRILSAYYLPDRGNKLLYSSISPVNTFRVIFNYYFGTNLDLLPDYTYHAIRDLSNIRGFERVIDDK